MERSEQVRNKGCHAVLILAFLAATSGGFTARTARADSPDASQAASDIGMKLVHVAKGRFFMGSPEDEPGHTDSESPLTKVILSNDFYLDTTPVTQGQYVAIMGSHNSPFPDAGDQAPVVSVSWDDAMAFCQKLTDREHEAKHLTEGYEFALPTEAQWEWACRAGTTGAYSGDIDSIAWYAGNSNKVIHPVGQKQPNSWGLFDMQGLVREWCRDKVGIIDGQAAVFQLHGGIVKDPSGPESYDGPYRIVRGASWNSSAEHCRSAVRMWGDGTHGQQDIGFRVAVVPMSQHDIMEENVRRQAVANSGSAQPATGTEQPNLPSSESALVDQVKTDTGIELVSIPAGSFVMGNPPGTLPATGPETEVTLTQGYLMSATVIREKQYATVEALPYKSMLNSNRVMMSRSWDDAIDFCAKLTQKEKAAGVLPAGMEFTLPTEAQWEYAWRAGVTGPCPFSHEQPMAVPFGPAPPIMGPPNAWGIRDSFGYADELCYDWYAPWPGGNVTDPMGPASGQGRVYRLTQRQGGVRGIILPSQPMTRLGFRVVLAPSRTTDQGSAAESHDLPHDGSDWTIPSLNVVMKYVAPGKFVMGTGDDVSDRPPNEAPPTPVTITRGYWLGTTKLTALQCELLDGGLVQDKPDNQNQPVGLTFPQACRFCDRLTNLEHKAGRLPPGYVYRLPTEAQWEYAARAGTTGACSGDRDSMAWHSQNIGNNHPPVAQKQPNPWGFYDIYGLSPEWCNDISTDSLPGVPQVDPLGAIPSVVTVFRVIRGVDVDLNPVTCRSAFRGSWDATSISQAASVRLALVPDQTFPEHDQEVHAIQYIIQTTPILHGVFKAGFQGIPMQLQLKLNPATQWYDGTITFPSLSAGSNVTGRIIDVDNQPPSLQLSEISPTTIDPTTKVPYGNTYSLRSDPQHPGRLVGSWNCIAYWEPGGTGGGIVLHPPSPDDNMTGGAQPRFARQVNPINTGVDSETLARLRTIDSGVPGTWQLKDGDQKWVIQRDGQFEITRPSANPAAQDGVSDFSIGNFLTLTTDGARQHGTYALADGNTLNITGDDGSKTWTRVAPPPPEPADSDDAASDQSNVKPSAPFPDDMVLIPGGSFKMGDQLDQIPNAVPVDVTVSKFYMEKTLVPERLSRKLLAWANRNGYRFPRVIFGYAGLTYPSTGVGWFDAVKLCNARSQMEGLTPVYYTDDAMTQVYRRGQPRTILVNWQANGYRLPTEAEWEWAARGGAVNNRFPWGNLISFKFANYVGSASLAYDLGPDGHSPAFPLVGGAAASTPFNPVNYFEPNAYGLCDMAGDASQWCWDWYDDTLSGGVDPHGPDEGKPGLARGAMSRVRRGGSCMETAEALRCAARNFADPTAEYDTFSFRCARTAQ